MVPDRSGQVRGVRLGACQGAQTADAGADPDVPVVERATVVRLRDERRIDDTVLRQVQAALDLEEARLPRRGVID